MDAIDKLRNRITLRHLKLLYAVGTELNLSRAARQLNTSQPAVSRALREMEELLEDRLFERSTRRISLTPQGRLLWRHAQRILHSVEYAVQDFQAARTGERGSLSIGLTGQVPATLIARAALCFDEGQQLRLDIREGPAAGIMQALAAGELDLVISHTSTGLVGTPLDVEILYEDNTCIVASADHPLLVQESVEWTDLRRTRWILPSKDLHVRTRVERDMMMRGVPDLSNALEASSIHVLIAMLSTTRAVSVMNQQVARSYQELGVLGIVPFDFRLGTARFALMRRQDVLASPACLQFSENIKAICAQWRESSGKAHGPYSTHDIKSAAR
jgi:DNA-binding transcriptional LysR family regulator